ncbi:MAG: flagellar type III secretion system pore protein FliP [Myxococcota bacterium]|nr:flagellar type III secretion system pore protein FliP [Myxococcota bacterium]
MLRLLPVLVALVALLVPQIAGAQDLAEPLVAAAEEARDVPVASTVRLLVILTGLTFMPAMLLVMTPFPRFIIVFSLLRQALGLQQSPPNQVLIGLALFLSMLVMRPTLEEVKTTALDPYLDSQIETTVALETGMKPMRRFMLANTRQTDMAAVMEMAQMERPEQLDDIPTPAVVSAFMLSELTTAFIIAFKIYIPFLVIDIVVANVLLGMGMMVLPPVIISLPFKLMLFVLMDGWNLLVRSMAAGFGGV